jgi:hypothetical protein
MLLPLYFKEVNKVTLKKEQTFTLCNYSLDEQHQFGDEGQSLRDPVFPPPLQSQQKQLSPSVVVTVLAVDGDR